MLCTDYCGQENNIINNPDCLSKCNSYTTSGISDQSSIIKKHNLYLAKYELINKPIETAITPFEGEEGKGLEDNIKLTTKNIENLKKQLYEEEKKLLSFYNLKKSD
jgi:hypothetical protein